MPKNTINQRLFKCFYMSCLVIIIVSVSNVRASNSLSLKETIKLAQEQDPWLSKNKNQQSALHAQSLSSSQLEDPKFSVNLANLPTDTLQFNQEAMTQFKIAVSQQFSRGETLMLKSKQLRTLSEQQPWLREARKANTSLIAANLWLDAYKAQASIHLIEKNKSLFEQLVEIAESGYASSFSKVHQQDVIRAELELTRLEDKLFSLEQSKQVALKNLSQWTNMNLLGQQNALTINGQTNNLSKTDSLLPRVDNLYPAWILEYKNNIYQSAEVLNQLKKHPVLISIDKKLAASNVAIELAKQSYKAKWGLNASYAYRDGSPAGINRADFFSVGVSLSMPLFSSTKQDNQVKAATFNKEAFKNDKWLTLKSFISAIETETVKLQKLQARHGLYQKTLLPQMRELTEAALNGYSNDVSDFTEVIRARISELDASVEKVSILVEIVKSKIQLNYYFIHDAEQLMNSISDYGVGYE